ncbi:hypothetical protein D3C71_1866600 [compost metagenome]
MQAIVTHAATQAAASLTETRCALFPPKTNRSSASIDSTKAIKPAHIAAFAKESIVMTVAESDASPALRYAGERRIDDGDEAAGQTRSYGRSVHRHKSHA